MFSPGVFVETDYWYCCRYSCIKERFPYFGHDWLGMKGTDCGDLLDLFSYDEEFKKQFGISLHNLGEGW